MMTTMTVLLLLLISALQASASSATQASAPHRQASPRSTPVGSARAGKAYWEQANTFCGECHGARGQGAYGPDLAGRQLTFQQFRHQVRTPWGAMPRWTPQQISDQTIADIRAYLTSLPTVDKPGPWNKPVPRNASLAVRYFTESYGCAQCHGTDIKPVLLGPSVEMLDFSKFTQIVYQHDSVFPTGRMGSFSPDRLPESVLRVMWNTVSHPRSAAGAKGK